MNAQDSRGFEAIWPRIGAEIGKARRRKEIRRRLPRWAIVFSAVALVLGLIRFAGSNGQKGCDGVPWNLARIEPVGDASAEYPLVSGTRVFAIHGARHERRVVCIRKISGAVEWESAAKFAECRFACDGRRLYLMCRETLAPWRCMALDLRNGSELWRRAAEDDDGASPSLLTTARGGVAWSRGARLICCDGENGETVWTRALDSGVRLSTPRALGESVVATSHGAVYAFQVASGELLWQRSIEQPSSIGREPALLELGEGRVYVAARTAAGLGRVSCLNAATGGVLWSAPSEVPLHLQVAAGQVLIRSTGLSVFDAQNGTPLWRAAVGGCGPISFGKERLYVVDAEARQELVALDSRSGQTAWRRKVAGSCSGVVADRGMGFISGRDGILHAVALN